ncbi:sensor histidine kinase [Streptomyces tanashiensis]
MAAVVALYTVASRTDRPTTWRVGLVTMAVLTAAAMIFGPTHWYAQENLGVFAWTGMAAAAGDAVRSRRAFVDAIRERAERAERTREEEAGRRVAEERLRIARDLHDVVAHHIALVNVQAGVAAHVMDKRPDQAKEALAHVREASRSALDELRATVGLLRQSGDPEAPTEPAPGLGVLDGLLDSFRKRRPARRPWPAPTRALTLPADRGPRRVPDRAGGPDQCAASTPDRTRRPRSASSGWDRTIEITVLDNGTPRTVPRQAVEQPPVGGHGLLGMRERVSALGGTLTAAPRYGGGFRVQAILPVTPRTGEGRRRTP